MNTENHQTIELRITFFGPSATKIKSELMQKLDTLPEIATAQGVVDGILEGMISGQNLDHVDAAAVFSETDDSSNISIFFGDQESADSFLEGLRKALSASSNTSLNPNSGWSPEFRSLRTATWQNAWRENFEAFSTERFDIVPFKDVANFEAAPGRHLVAIDPGEAFGTGQHATTLACIIALEKIWQEADSRKLPWRSLLDVGTGTGILGIAAAKFGFNDILATEVDPEAVKIAQNNMLLNNVKMSILETAEVPTGKLFDIVISNVLTEALIPLIPALVSATSSNGGRLLLAGYIENDTQRFVNLVEKSGGSHCFDVNIRGWVCQIFSRD